MRLTIFFCKAIVNIIVALCFYTASAQVKNAKYYTETGDGFFEKGKYDDAISNYSKAISLDAKYALAYGNRGYAYLQKKQANLVIPAIQDCTKAISLQPTAPDFYFYRGEAYTQKKVVDSAITDFTKAIQLGPDTSEYYTSRGKAYNQKSFFDLAVPDFTKAIKLRPDNPDNYVNRAAAYYQKRQYDSAIIDYTKIINLNPRIAESYNSRFKAYYNNNQLDLALADISKAISIDPSIAFYYNNRGLCYNSLGKYELSVQDYINSLIKSSVNSKAYFNIISPLVRMLRFNDALFFYNLNKENKANSFLGKPEYKFYNSFITAFTQVSDSVLNKALETLELSAKEYGDDIKEETKRAYIDILFLKGYILEKLNREDEAKIVYEKSLAIDSRQPDLSQALQRIQQKTALTRTTDKTPPEIELKNPAPTRGFEIEADNIKTQITIRAKDESGIASVKIDTANIDKIDEDGYIFLERYLKPGTNTIVVTATDKAGNSASKTLTINAKAAANNTLMFTDQSNLLSSKIKYHAIFIAENIYNDPIPDLEHPINDARALKNILQNEYTFDAANIDTLYNRSRVEIMQKIDQVSSSLDSNDNLLIFYAGHGTTTLNRDNTRDGYLIPSDAISNSKSTYISLFDLKSVIKNSNAKHILLIADACFSGALTRELPKDASAAIKLQYETTSRAAMTSGNLTTVPDVSKFLFYLKQKLNENKEKYLSAKKLFDSFSEIVLNNTDPPTAPLFRGIQDVGDEGGQFIFIRKNK